MAAKGLQNETPEAQEAPTVSQIIQLQFQPFVGGFSGDFLAFGVGNLVWKLSLVYSIRVSSYALH